MSALAGPRPRPARPWCRWLPPHSCARTIGPVRALPGRVALVGTHTCAGQMVPVPFPGGLQRRGSQAAGASSAGGPSRAQGLARHGRHGRHGVPKQNCWGIVVLGNCLCLALENVRSQQGQGSGWTDMESGSHPIHAGFLLNISHYFHTFPTQHLKVGPLPSIRGQTQPKPIVMSRVRSKI